MGIQEIRKKGMGTQETCIRILWSGFILNLTSTLWAVVRITDLTKQEQQKAIGVN